MISHRWNHIHWVRRWIEIFGGQFIFIELNKSIISHIKGCLSLGITFFINFLPPVAIASISAPHIVPPWILIGMTWLLISLLHAVESLDGISSTTSLVKMILIQRNIIGNDRNYIWYALWTNTLRFTEMSGMNTLLVTLKLARLVLRFERINLCRILIFLSPFLFLNESLSNFRKLFLIHLHTPFRWLA